MHRLLSWLVPTAAISVAFISFASQNETEPSALETIAEISAVESAQAPESTIASEITEGAWRVIETKTAYLETYERLFYPGGDVPDDYGVCTDLVVRAYRNAGVDLQQLLHEDRVEHPEAYPTHLWEYKKPDRNIDHRRCQNLVTFFDRHAEKRSVELDSDSVEDWKAGDVVFFIQENAAYPYHVAVVSEERTFTGIPMILHLYPPVAAHDPANQFGEIHSRYRWPETN